MRKFLDRDRRRSSRPPPRAGFDSRTDGQQREDSTLTKRERDALGRRLVKAAGAGLLPEVKTLTRDGAPVDWPGKYGRTALMEAALAGHYPVVEFLLNNGAGIAWTDQDSKTARALALEKKHWAVVLLLERAEGYNPYD